MTNSSHTSQHSQQGATLIVVLMVLLMITIVGVVALKKSRTDLKLATSDQVNTLLLQASDAPIKDLEEIINNKDKGSTTAEKKKAMQMYSNLVDNKTGLFGYFMQDEGESSDVYSYCFTADTDYKLNKATITSGGGVLSPTSTTGGSCYKGGSANFTTSMNVAITQVSVSKKGASETEVPFSHLVEGEDASQKTAIKHMFNVYATSAIPVYNDDLKTGYSSTVYSDPDTLQDHMKEKGVPYTTVYEQVDVFKDADPKICGYGDHMSTFHDDVNSCESTVGDFNFDDIFDNIGTGGATGG